MKILTEEEYDVMKRKEAKSAHAWANASMVIGISALTLSLVRLFLSLLRH